MKQIIFLGSLLFLLAVCQPNTKKEYHSQSANSDVPDPGIVMGAYQFDEYLPALTNTNVALIVNQTSTVEQTHLVDTLIALGVNVKKIFAPEHGFRGTADAGEHVENGIDKKSGTPLISLYGKNKKPTPDMLRDIDVVLFDIQDVGVRFYTYISTMHYVMEACAENNKKFIVLDRPNPNGHYVDGPVLDLKFQSFVGIHPIPIVHGLTVGELAHMINKEGWLNTTKKCELHVIPMKNYTHRTSYSLPIKPSPNLPNDQSIKLYPTLCLFEGTAISVARGTYFPFQAIGFPNEKFGSFSFTPVSIDGMSKYPPHQDRECFGLDLRKVEVKNEISLKYVIDFYNKAPDKTSFFNNYFSTLVGNDTLKQQIMNGVSEAEIKKSWESELSSYKAKREKYLLYP
ncbi:DUF1343 domain-containing protein [Fulvivirgaceae bacterium BMA10]|uniref:DUF1343 domain-containing protein n=1 Tax=Splendidivirga corallicola TaxID=3051826 RepID=A0ABT8KR01_9BACT|nr:DUF1343 domain-containing protein [Fulvivirgaceae bacterium BMA10]